MTIKKRNFIVLCIQAAVMVILIILPALGTYFTTHNRQEAIIALQESLPWFLPIILVYLVNYYLLVPYLYQRNKWLFILANALLIFLMNLGWYEDDFYEEPYYSDYYIFIILDLLMNALSAACALGVRHILRLHEVEIQLEEMKHKSMEAELVWLKNQLNPHFLFNTLNNISSLVYIDADHAQDSITKLSDLLRYALYESSKAEVSLSDEVEFMQNYISLMKLRCSDKVKVETYFDLSQPGVKIAPMLFISVLENAFKHGVSTHQPSFIHASLCVKDDNIVFTCDNSNFPKKDKNLTAGGVGIENTQRRLELLYPQRSKYVHTLQDDIYHVEIKIKL